MPEEKKTKIFWKKMKIRYHLKIFNDDTYQETWFFKFSRLKLYSILIISSIIIIAIIFSLIVYTPIREIIPGYPNKLVRQDLIRNAVKLDSLEQELKKKDLFFESIQRVINGEEPLDFENNNNETSDTRINNVVRSSQDTALRAMVEQEESFNLNIFDNEEFNSSLRNIIFYCPMSGHVSARFNSDTEHYGIDIVADENEEVCATLDGTVMIASWDVESGYMILIQHKYNLVSIYKHNSDIMRSPGDIVKAGEPIAIIGNSGELTTGQHLHFELWHNQKALNPEEYIVF